MIMWGILPGMTNKKNKTTAAIEKNALPYYAVIKIWNTWIFLKVYLLFIILSIVSNNGIILPVLNLIATHTIYQGIHILGCHDAFIHLTTNHFAIANNNKVWNWMAMSSTTEEEAVHNIAYRNHENRLPVLLHLADHKSGKLFSFLSHKCNCKEEKACCPLWPFHSHLSLFLSIHLSVF